MRDLIIIILIFIIIFCGNLYMKNYLERTTGEMINNLETLKNEIILAKETENREKSKEEIDKIYNQWKELEDEWAMIILHDELDLIETSITKMKSGIQDGDLNKAMEELEATKFLINHIKEKEKFALKNIF